MTKSRAYPIFVLSLLTSINFFNYVDRMVIVTMGPQLQRIFHLTDFQVGTFWTAFFVVHALTMIPFGWASDRFDRRRVMAIGVIGWSFATLFSAYATGFVMLLALRGAIGIGEAAYGPSSNALLCEIYPSHKARAVAIFNAGMLVGAAMGMAAGTKIGFPHAFQAVAFPGLALGVLVLTLKVPETRTKMMMPGNPWVNAYRSLQVKTLLWMLPSGVLISFAAGGYIEWILQFTVRVKHIDEGDATTIYSIIVLTAGLFGVIAGGIVADRLHRRYAHGRLLTVAIGFLAAVPFGFGVIYIDAKIPYLICSWLLLFFLPWYNGPMAAVIDDVVDDNVANTAQASFAVLLHLLGTGPGSLVVGALIRPLGLRVAYSVNVWATVGAGLFALLASRFVGADAEARRERLKARVLPVEVAAL
jgi:predicted MFS family arabinose efflux permease